LQKNPKQVHQVHGQVSGWHQPAGGVALFVSGAPLCTTSCHCMQSQASHNMHCSPRNV
jgi:hypothetical protein